VSKNVKIKVCRTTVLPVVLCGCDTWSHTLREGRRLRVFENSVLRRISGPKRDEVTGRKLHIAEFNDLYSSPNIIQVIISRTMSWARHEGRVAERFIQGLVGKTEEKSPLGRPCHR